MDLYQIWFRGSPRGRNQMCGILLQSAHRFRFCEGSKFAISHWLGWSPLTQCWRYRAACEHSAGATAQPVILLTFKQVFLIYNERYNIIRLFYLCFKKVNLLHICDVEIYTKSWKCRVRPILNIVKRKIKFPNSQPNWPLINYDSPEGARDFYDDILWCCWHTCKQTKFSQTQATKTIFVPVPRCGNNLLLSYLKRLTITDDLQATSTGDASVLATARKAVKGTLPLCLMDV